MTPKLTGAERIVHQHELDLAVGMVVGEVEIAARLDVKVNTVATWTHSARTKRPGRRHTFPPPRWTVSGLPAWYWPDVEQWAQTTGRLPKTTAT